MDPAWIKAVPGWERLRHYNQRINRRLDDRIEFIIRALDQLRNEFLAVPPSTGAVYTPEPMWFPHPVTKDSNLAPTPGTANAGAISDHGRIAISYATRINVVHFHFDHPAGSGHYDLELYRLRPTTSTPGPGWLNNPTKTLIATCTDNGSAGDFHTTTFTFLSESFKDLLPHDYLAVQATSKMTGGGSAKAAGFIDVHFEDATLDAP